MQDIEDHKQVFATVKNVGNSLKTDECLLFLKILLIFFIFSSVGPSCGNSLTEVVALI